MRARQLRGGLNAAQFQTSDIDELKRQGRL